MVRPAAASAKTRMAGRISPRADRFAIFGWSAALVLVLLLAGVLAAELTAARVSLLALGVFAILLALVMAGVARAYRRQGRLARALEQRGERLRQAEHQYHDLYQHSPSPIMVYDLEDLRMLEVNVATEAYYGYSREELLARHVTDLVVEGERDKLRGIADAVIAGQAQPRRNLWTMLHADGHTTYGDIHSRNVEFDGHVARLCVLIDQNERILAERQLAASEKRFSAVARVSNDAIWDYELDTGHVWWSEGYYARFGYDAVADSNDIEAWADRLHPDDRDKVTASLKAAMESGREQWQERYRFLCKDGSYASILDRGIVMLDGQGRPERMVGGMVDRAAEAAANMLQRAVETVHNGIVIADALSPDYPVVYVNPAFEKMTGYSAREMMGRNCRLLQGEDREQPGIEEIRKALREESEVSVVLRNYRRDGELFWCELRVMPVRESDGRVTHFLGVQQDISERLRVQQRLDEQANHDELTGLPNRRMVRRCLRELTEKSARSGGEFALIFIGLDQFKLINDALGHAVGDSVLKEIASRLKRALEKDGLVGRFGGDEFAVLAPVVPTGAPLENLITRIEAVVREPITVQGASRHLSPSIGVVLAPRDGRDADTLIRNADAAMYEAKKRGRARVVHFSSTLHAAAMRRLEVVTRLRNADYAEEFELHYQTMHSVSDRGVTGLEVLLRWPRGPEGFRHPGAFITICEESGLIVGLGDWVLLEACRRQADVARLVGHPCRIAVNVSAQQFMQRGFMAKVRHALDRSGADPNLLEIELTESSLIADPPLAARVMESLKGLGVHLAIDDFGTGYCSLAYLKRLPVDKLKIDRSFIGDLPRDREDVAICSSIITLAHSLDLSVTAEGVETEAQTVWLRENGCDEMQGFHLSMPTAFPDSADAVP